MWVHNGVGMYTAVALKWVNLAVAELAKYPF